MYHMTDISAHWTFVRQFLYSTWYSDLFAVLKVARSDFANMFLTELFNAFIKSISAVVHLVEYILDVYLRRLHSTLRCGIVYLRQFSAYFAHCKFVDHRFFPFKSIHKYKSLLCSCGRNIFKPELFAKIFILCLLPFIRVECQIVHI